MTAYENSAARQAAAIRAHARRGVWRPILSAVGVTVHTRAADAEASSWDAGDEGERRTRELLRGLPRSWWVGHDRAIPGLDWANADHLAGSPGARLFLIDSKMLGANAEVHVGGGRLWHGQRPMDRDMRSIGVEAQCIADAVGVQVWRLMCVHNASVAGGGFTLDGVGVVPAGRLLERLIAHDGPAVPRAAAALARRAARILPQYAK